MSPAAVGSGRTAGPAGAVVGGRRSSSIHTLNADRGLGRLGRRLYFLLNRINNLLPGFSGAVPVRRFRRLDFDYPSEVLPATASPGRLLSNLFWMSLPWPEIERELGSLGVLDLGCGRGGYCHLLDRISGGRIATYTGVDAVAQPTWPEVAAQHRSCRFHAIPAERVAEVLSGDTNLVISQSALEHIEQDLAYFDRMRRFVLESRRPLIQVHIVPAPGCLSLYRLHGVRQYPLRAIARIARRFDGFSQCHVFALGGAACAALHRAFITPGIADRRRDRRFQETDLYTSLLPAAVRDDMTAPVRSAAVARRALHYAIAIHSFPRMDLFGRWQADDPAAASTARPTSGPEATARC